MKLEGWEPDLRTLLARIDEGELDLQPDFQRGLVWNTNKQQRLIDTILRGWSVPPIHLLVLPDENLAVLDGQQRLRAIQSFVADEFRIGTWEPHDPEIHELEGCVYSNLPDHVKRRFNNYKISSFRLYEYEPAEPFELFFRLNLPTGLTQAEKRNALVGDSRQQIRKLVEFAEQSGWDAESIGFANARMAYDDTLARCCTYVERNTLRLALTATELEAQYRLKGGFLPETTRTVEYAIQSMASALRRKNPKTPLNKATLLTWLLAYCRQVSNDELRSVDLAQVLVSIEIGRAYIRRPKSVSFRDSELPPQVRPYLELYNDRASSRVTDVLSVVARDAAVWLIVAETTKSTLAFEQINTLSSMIGDGPDSSEEPGQRILEILENPRHWGEIK